jgi:type III restriction enzyme
MSQDNPILNNPYEEPCFHYATNLDETLNYNDIRKGRRPFTGQVMPIPVKQGPQAELISIQENEKEYARLLPNIIRKEVGTWRKEGYPGTTRVTKELLNYWFLNPDRSIDKYLFFAQREALETAIWLNEVAEKSNAGSFILQKIKEAQAGVSDNRNDYLPRQAFKMATGTGKTVVMAALILYHYFNRQEYRADVRFADCFLLVAPGITIKDRLGVLRVDTATANRNEIKDYYRQRGLVPPHLQDKLEGLNARLVITNYHQFELRGLQGNKRSPMDGKTDINGAKLSRPDAKEDANLMIKRVLGGLRPGSRLLILNDEAHHCYLPKAKGSRSQDGDNSSEENERAMVWFRGLRDISTRFQIRHIYDLSATPYYLRGSGYDAYSLFPWVVSDFGLVEAIESGLVKIPFMPELDNTQELSQPVLANLYEHIRKSPYMPSKMGMSKKRTEANKKGEKLAEAKPVLPETLVLALKQFIDHYEAYDKGLREAGEKAANLFTEPPVFIAVCNNTSVSKEVYKYLAGYEYEDAEGNTVVVPGHFPIFSNYDVHTRQPLRKRPSLLIDSDALEHSGQVGDDFKKVFAPEIAAFKKDYRTLHPDRSVEALTDADILREVVNTVGKPGALGSHIRCVVSVSMLTEGWDANTVTHIVGIRAFGSQLLCEQVAGRALRRRNYILDPKTKKFPPEYAHIIGVPFKMFKGGETQPPPPQPLVHVKALPAREADFEIQFPQLTGYRVEMEEDALVADFSGVEPFVLDFSKQPVWTKLGNAFEGKQEQLEIREHKSILRDQQVVFKLANEMLKLKFHDDAGRPLFQHFGALKEIVAEWYDTRLLVKGDTDRELRRLIHYWPPSEVVSHIHKGIDAVPRSGKTIRPVWNPYNRFGSTRFVSGNTVKEVYATTKSHVNYVVQDSDWEAKAAKALEADERVLAYVKNQFLGFGIPYVSGGKDRLYYPDFIVRCKAASGATVNLIIEVTGMAREKADKKHYLEHFWLPAVNGVRTEYGMDSWHFVEVANDIRDFNEQANAVLTSL